ncbi:cell division protein FtsH [Brenneria goodwinii]|uniref:Cell division protein FtsH n=1 Tax=Brenneria goodwinii TaxID=1109412 RepID=A0A0G4JRF7_9GAMM|nr:YqjK-like family protein [Brenneria goodwinii]ATA25439.1 cell division protein FtsH [Brenneria goodwinii]MCG8156504.1 YqjK-like family protein [Brenneria goodwinii]MCG8162125.1 YqjK-like family protein [Brenneria goodwinii]MCG8166833.1 YqjK-like family protein [Brenneria goodwinii]MCG8171483.1 YqjK-like family protein [Brenneria goodwinii]
MSHQQRDKEKIQLLRKIQQQRLDLSANKKSLLESTAPYDRYWHNLLQWRKYWVVGSGLIAIYGLRHPSKLILWGRRAVGLWGTFRFFRKTLSRR